MNLFGKKKSTQLQEYIKDFNTDKNRLEYFNFGKSSDNQFIKKNMFVEPNALFVGSMGSGKSVAANFVLNDYLLRNMDKTTTFVVDLLKGGADYNHLYNKESVMKVRTLSVLTEAINFAYEEAKFRCAVMQNEEISNLVKYEEKSNKKISRILFVIEEAHILSKALNFEAEKQIEGSVASKLSFILRVGRSVGIWFMMVSQSATTEHFPHILITNLTNKSVFRVPKKESEYLTGTASASFIGTGQHGYAYNDNGEMISYPYIKQEEWADLLIKHHKPMKASIFTASLKELKEKFMELEDIESKEEQITRTLNNTIGSVKFKSSVLIRQYRTDNSLSNKEFADFLDMDESNLSKIIVNQKEKLDKITVDSLLKILVKLSLTDERIKKYLDNLSKVV